jgi:glycosyltransferase involved in cell wall biosynthesis
MYIHDTCKADRSFPIRFKELKIEPNSTYVFGHEHDIENLANQSFICAFSYNIIEKYGDSFDTVVSKEVAIGMEAGTGPSITKFGNVKYVGKRKTFFLSDHYDEGKLRYKSFYKEFGIYKFHTCDDDLHLDFLEIGTSDFDVETDLSKKGMFVEPIGKYLKRLPEQIKINAAITHDKDCDTCNVFYIDDVDIQKNNLPQWLKGCNSIHKPHAFHEKFSHLVKKSEVKLLNISELFQIYKIKSLKKLKIDTEGHDTVIMKGLYEYLKTAPFSAKPHDIIFETNEHTSTEAVDETVRLMKEHGYKLFERGFDTHLKLVRTAVLSETVYALGKIHTSLQRRMEHCDFIDWNNHSQITNFMKNWKDYGCIISTTSLMKLDIDDPEFYKRTMFVVHYPSTSNDHFKERLNDKMIHKGGVSKEISKMLDVPFLPCGYDPDVFTFERFPKELKTIGFVGKYDPGSIYEDTKRSEMFKKIATSVGIEYKFITGITDPKKLYNDVDLIVCTSTAEGGPLGPIEAGAIGVPSISTPVGNMVDIESIRKYNTIEEAVDIIRGFIENPSTFQEYSEKVHKEITEKWNWNYIFKTYWDKEIKSILQTTRA